MEAAVDCFSALGMSNPKKYLDEVMSFATGAGTTPRAIGGASAPRDRIEFFQSLLGENPAYYEGYEELDEILGHPPIERKGNTLRWCDARFPTKWIPEWRKKSSV